MAEVLKNYTGTSENGPYNSACPIDFWKCF